MQQAFRGKRPGKLSKMIIILHDNAPLHTADLTNATLATMGWEVTNHPPYSPDLAPSDFHLFGPVKVHLGRKFQTDELRRGVLKWLHSRDNIFYTAVISNLQGELKKKRVSVMREYLEKE
jgi:transposase